MGDPEQLFLEFFSDQFTFLIPLSDVNRVMDEDERERRLPTLKISDLTGERPDLTKKRYLILLEYAGHRFGVMTEGIRGICGIEPERLIVLKEPVLNEKNRYLKAVVELLRQEGKRELAFVLDTERLYGRLREKAENQKGGIL